MAACCGPGRIDLRKLNVLINNAGIAHGDPILETTDETWDRVMAINGKGVFLGTRAAIPAMQRPAAAPS